MKKVLAYSILGLVATYMVLGIAMHFLYLGADQAWLKESGREIAAEKQMTNTVEATVVSVQDDKLFRDNPRYAFIDTDLGLLLQVLMPPPHVGYRINFGIGESTTYVVTYEINGKQYKEETLYLNTTPPPKPLGVLQAVKNQRTEVQDTLTRILPQIPPGGKIMLYYNPNHPEEVSNWGKEQYSWK